MQPHAINTYNIHSVFVQLFVLCRVICVHGRTASCDAVARSTCLIWFSFIFAVSVSMFTIQYGIETFL
jgi:hypothetical protein